MCVCVRRARTQTQHQLSLCVLSAFNTAAAAAATSDFACDRLLRRIKRRVVAQVTTTTTTTFLSSKHSTANKTIAAMTMRSFLIRDILWESAAAAAANQAAAAAAAASANNPNAAAFANQVNASSLAAHMLGAYPHSSASAAAIAAAAAAAAAASAQQSHLPAHPQNAHTHTHTHLHPHAQLHQQHQQQQRHQQASHTQQHAHTERKPNTDDLLNGGGGSNNNKNHIDAQDDDDDDEEIEVDGDYDAERRTSDDQNSNADVDDEDSHEDDDEDDDDDVADDEEIDVSGRHNIGSARSRLAGNSSGGCGDDIDVTLSTRSTQQQQQQQQQHMPNSAALQQHLAQQTNSPLDALFQMTSNTFDALKRGEKRKERDTEPNGSTGLTSKQTSKKKRKSRTAFTHQQIYELERRFNSQKYLSPTDRDEIALSLNLTNAQVITWFQNRRAKLKRDLEEQRRDIETASILSLHKQFLEAFQALNHMKTTAIKTDDGVCGTAIESATASTDRSIGQLGSNK